MVWLCKFACMSYQWQFQKGERWAYQWTPRISAAYETGPQQTTLHNRDVKLAIPNHVDTVATVKKVRFVIEKAWTPSLPPVFVTQLEYGWDKAVQCLNQKLGCFKSGIVIPPVVGDGSGPRKSLSAYQYRIAGETVLRKCQVLVTRSLKFTLLVRAGSLKPSEGRVWTCGIEEMAKARWFIARDPPNK